MTRSIPAIYENGVFRPIEPVDDLPEHTSVRLTVEAPTEPTSAKRVWGLQRDKIISIAPDFDADLGEEFWFSKP